MRLLPLILALALPLAACGGGGGATPPPPTSPYTLHVDAGAGSDQSDGSVLAPFATITFALGQAQAGDSIKVAPGLYDTASGESFPLSVPAGVQLIGDEAARGDGATPTALIGSGLAADLFAGNANTFTTVELGDGAQLIGFRVTNPVHVGGHAEMAVALAQPNAAVLRCTIRNSVGIGIATHLAADNIVLADNHMINNRTGLHVRDGTAIRFEDNYVIDNQLGVETTRAIDMGGGAMASAGGNTIAWNDHADLKVINGTGITVAAQQNHWNNVAPTVSVGSTNPMDGSDVWIYNAADAADTTGATPAVPLP